MAGGTEMRIGKGLWAGSQSYYGWMDEFAMWDAVLDEATIQEYLRTWMKPTRMPMISSCITPSTMAMAFTSLTLLPATLTSH